MIIMFFISFFDIQDMTIKITIVNPENVIKQLKSLNRAELFYILKIIII